MKPEDKPIVEAMLMTAPEFHIIAHIADDRFFEFAGTAIKRQRADGETGSIELEIVGHSEAEDASLFKYISHPLLIELNPLGTPQRLNNNLKLRYARIEFGDFGGSNLRLSARITDVSNARACDTP